MAQEQKAKKRRVTEYFACSKMASSKWTSWWAIVIYCFAGLACIAAAIAVTIIIIRLRRRRSVALALAGAAPALVAGLGGITQDAAALDVEDSDATVESALAEPHVPEENVQALDEKIRDTTAKIVALHEPFLDAGAYSNEDFRATFGQALADLKSLLLRRSALTDTELVLYSDKEVDLVSIALRNDTPGIERKYYMQVMGEIQLGDLSQPASVRREAIIHALTNPPKKGRRLVPELTHRGLRLVLFLVESIKRNVSVSASQALADYLVYFILSDFTMPPFGEENRYVKIARDAAMRLLPIDEQISVALVEKLGDAVYADIVALNENPSGFARSRFHPMPVERLPPAPVGENADEWVALGFI